MNRAAIDQLVSDYLESLRIATADLPPAERDELSANIVEHITTSMDELDPPNEAAVRTILNRLGDPADIAAEARIQSTRALTAPASAPGPGWLEWGGVAMLAIGSYVLPVIGTVAGLTMISMSRWWSTRQKVVAALLSLAGVVAIPIVGFLVLFPLGTAQNGPRPATPIVSGQPAMPAVPASPTSS
jgi:hypothetical protein